MLDSDNRGICAHKQHEEGHNYILVDTPDLKTDQNTFESSSLGGQNLLLTRLKLKKDNSRNRLVECGSFEPKIAGQRSFRTIKGTMTVKHRSDRSQT